jgi:hypothetical protein
MKACASTKRVHRSQRGFAGRAAIACAAFGFLFVARTASAQDKPAKGVITLAEVTIVGRIQKPIASVDVNRIQPKLTLQELRQPFLDKIEQVLYSDPF